MFIKALQVVGIGLALVCSVALTAQDIRVYNLSKEPFVATILYTDKGRFYTSSEAKAYTIEGYSYQDITIPPHIPAVEATKKTPFKAAIAWTFMVAPKAEEGNEYSFIKNFVNGGKLEFGARVELGTEGQRYFVFYAVADPKVADSRNSIFVGETKMIIEIDTSLASLKQKYKFSDDVPRALEDFKENSFDKPTVIKQEEKIQAEVKTDRSSIGGDRKPLAEISTGKKDQKPVKPATIKRLGT